MNSQMRRRAVIWLSFKSERHLKTVLNALKPETGKSLGSRSRTKVEKEDGKLKISFEAKDTSALRAAISAYLRWVSLVQNMLESVDGFSTNKGD